jgi:hypothetical protein
MCSPSFGKHLPAAARNAGTADLMENADWVGVDSASASGSRLSRSIATKTPY